MKSDTIFFTLLAGILALASTHTTQAGQERTTEQQEAKARADRQRLDEASNLGVDTKAEARVAKANAKESKRIDQEAAYTAKHAKRAARMEAKAQRNHTEADK